MSELLVIRVNYRESWRDTVDVVSPVLAVRSYNVLTNTHIYKESSLFVYTRRSLHDTLFIKTYDYTCSLGMHYTLLTLLSFFMDNDTLIQTIFKEKLSK